jgi:hypothetical protein
LQPLSITDSLADQALGIAGITHPYRREPIRAWALSAVERVHAHSGTVILKAARQPLTAEGDVLAHVARQGLPVPSLEAAVTTPDETVMVLEDLGAPDRDAALGDAAIAAVSVHQIRPPAGVPVVDRDALAALPTVALERIGQLHATGRWPEPDPDIDALARLTAIADTRSEGTDLAPFGFCHSEFHPTSLHITEAGWHVLDLARAFTGPGLLDLASWQGTTEAPDLTGLEELIDAYVAAGGADTAHAKRGGLAAAQWAMGWHRLWAIAWYLEQQTTWIADPDLDDVYRQTIRRHLAEAVECLRPT